MIETQKAFIAALGEEEARKMDLVPTHIRMLEVFAKSAKNEDAKMHYTLFVIRVAAHGRVVVPRDLCYDVAREVLTNPTLYTQQRRKATSEEDTAESTEKVEKEVLLMLRGCDRLGLAELKELSAAAD